MAKEARNGLRLLDRLVLFLAWVATCGLVYVLGFYVGKGTHEQQLGKHQRVVRLPINAAPPPPDERTARSNEFTFYETLTAGRHETGAEGEPVQPSPSPAAPAAPSPGQAPQAAPPPAETRTAPAEMRTASPGATPKAPAAPSAAQRPPAQPQAAARAPEPARPTPPPAAPPPPAQVAVGGRWTVEVSPTQNRLELEALRARLSDKGYDARVVTIRRDGNTWYRLRVGRYSTSEQATRVMRTLREQEGVPRVFVASQ